MCLAEADSYTRRLELHEAILLWKFYKEVRTIGTIRDSSTLVVDGALIMPPG